MTTDTVLSAQDAVERALAASTGDGCVVIAEEDSSANLRWASNALTTNGVTRSRRITVIATVDGGKGTAVGALTRSGLTADGVTELVAAAEAAARESQPAEDARELVSGVPASPDWDDAPAETSIGVFTDVAPALGDAFARSAAAGRELFGFAHHTLTSTYLGTSAGLRLRSDQPTGTFELNGKSPDYARSAWTGHAGADFGDLDVAALEADVAQRLAWAERKVELPAGRYETLLPPSAVADLLVYLLWSTGARDSADGRTAFSKPGGGTRIGERLSPLPVTLTSDPRTPGLECTPFVLARASGSDSSVFDNGLPLARTDWIKDGTLSALLTSRHSAEATGLPVTPEIDNLVFSVAGADAPMTDLVTRTDRGLLLTCLWYIREVDPQTLLLTGLTRDGVYLVEGGEVVGAVNNFRFNESPVDLLSRIVEAGTPTRTMPREWGDYFSRAVTPPLRVADFNMSSVSQAS